jgi:hypothetical protein
MDIKARQRVVTELVAKLRSDMDAVISDVPDHWEEEELEWLMVGAENMTSIRSDIGLRRKSFKMWMLSKHL